MPLDPISTLATGFPILSLLILLPLVAAVAVWRLPDPAQARQAGVAGAAATLALALVAVLMFRSGHAGLQLAESLPWIGSIGVRYALGIDGLSVLFLPLTAFVFLAILTVAPEAARGGARAHAAAMLVLLSATMGLYTATDLILFFCFFEIALVPAWFLIKARGIGDDTSGAARRYVVFMLAGSLPLLAGFILAGVAAARVTGDALSFDIATLAAADLPMAVQAGVLALVLLGFAVKAPAIPLHVWMSDTLLRGPVGFGAYILGLKVGTYGFLRFCLPLAPDAAMQAAPYVITLEVGAILYAALIALTRRTLKSLLIFASVSHVGLITAAAFTGTADAWQGALLLMVNAGLATAGLWLCAGFIERRIGSGEIAAMGGMARRAPRLAALVFACGMALIGVPGTSGFAGEILALQGLFAAHWAWGVAAAGGVVLSASYFLWFFQRAFLGPVQQPAVARMRDLDGRETVYGAVLIVAILLLGALPGTLARATGPSVAAITAALQPEVAADRLLAEAAP